MSDFAIRDDIIELFDRLVELQYSATKEIAEIEGKLANIHEADPKDVNASIALLQTKVMLGKADEGLVLAEQIWKQGGKITPVVEATYMDQLVALGLFDWCEVLLRPKLENGDFDLTLMYPTLFACATGLGSLELLERAANIEGTGDEGEILGYFVAHQREANLEEHFAKQQKEVNKLLRGKQCAYEVLLETERGWPELEIGVFCGGDSVDRYQIQGKIDKAQKDYYEELDVKPLDNLTTTIYDLKEHWPPQGPEYA